MSKLMSFLTYQHNNWLVRQKLQPFFLLARYLFCLFSILLTHLYYTKLNAHILTVSWCEGVDTKKMSTILIELHALDLHICRLNFFLN